MIARLLGLLPIMLSTSCALNPVGERAPIAAFEQFTYKGMDAAYEQPLADGMFFNPIVAGFYPDPSVVRVGSDFYMVHSSFAYVPGLPVLHSRNLVDWNIIGHAFTTPNQVKFDGAGVSRGIFAPTIRHHNGVFYIITTAIDDAGGNLILTATDPAGPWSDPIYLPEIDGIDPDLFFDDDGRAYIAHNGPPPEGKSLYDGHRAIYLWEFDLDAERVVGPPTLLVNGGVDLAAEPDWIEAPHIYKINGWYYLWCAEGGTADNHSEVVFRSRSVRGPYQSHPNNPILTQRELDPARPQPVATAGHADLVQTPAGEWWAVFLATRNYEQSYFNTGRETFLLPVTWRDGWPYMLPTDQPVPSRLTAPAGLPATPDAERLSGNFTWIDEFDGKQLGQRWLWLRTADPDWLRQRQGQLQLVPQSDRLDSAGDIAFVGKRQQHLSFDASLVVAVPSDLEHSAGLAIFQNEQHHYYLGVMRNADGGVTLFLEQAKGAEPVVVAKTEISDYSQLQLSVSARQADLAFSVTTPDGETLWRSPPQDAKVLSTQVAGGFVGTVLGPHARLE